MREIGMQMRMATDSASDVVPDVIDEGTAFSTLALTTGPATLAVGAALDLLGYGIWGGLIGGLGLFFLAITVASYAIIWWVGRRALD